MNVLQWQVMINDSYLWPQRLFMKGWRRISWDLEQSSHRMNISHWWLALCHFYGQDSQWPHVTSKVRRCHYVILHVMLCHLLSSYVMSLYLMPCYVLSCCVITWHHSHICWPAGHKQSLLVPSNMVSPLKCVSCPWHVTLDRICQNQSVSHQLQ